MVKVITSTTIDTTITQSINGVERTFIAYIPARCLQGCGVMIMFHGGGGDAISFRDSMTIDSIAKQEKFVVLYPNGIDGNWNDGRTAVADGPDDIAFIKQIIWYMYQHYGTSNNNVFGSGISNGAMLLHWVMAKAPNVFAGIAPVAGNIPSVYLDLCTNSKPIVQFHGTLDPLNPFNGGPGGFGGDGEDISSSYTTIAKYATNTKAKPYKETNIPTAVEDGTSVVKRTYPGGSTFPTILYIINNGGHTWPGGKNKGTSQPIVGKCTSQIDATQIIVNVFRQHGLSAY